MTVNTQGVTFINMFDPASSAAREIAELSILVHILMLLVFLVVAIVLTLIFWRYRRRPDERVLHASHGNTKLEIIWTVTPALLLAVVFFIMLRVMGSVDAGAGMTEAAPTDDPAAARPLRVEVIGRLWWFEFRIPELNVRTDNELHLPLGRPIELALTSNEVLHSFWVPQLQGKRDNIPGQWNYVPLVADREGVYTGNCVEYCGPQHAWMYVRVVVEPEEAFMAWAQQQASDAVEPQEALVERGRDVYFESNCVNCHTIRGTESQENAGPDLTHVASREIMAGGVVEVNRDDMERWLRDPQEVKPGNLMPATLVSDEDLEALVAYMLSLE